MEPPLDSASTPGEAEPPPATAADLDRRARLARREPGALEWFYDEYFDRIYGYVRRLLREEHLAEDVTQDIFMHLHRSLSSYDPRRELRPWVFTIATNKVRDFWRSRRHKDSLREVGVEDEEGNFAPSPHRGPSEMLESRELGGLVGEAIEALPEGMRQTLMLRYFEGLSFADIGAIIERNETAVRKRYSRALAELRKSLAGVLGQGAAGLGAAGLAGGDEP